MYSLLPAILPCWALARAVWNDASRHADGLVFSQASGFSVRCSVLSVQSYMGLGITPVACHCGQIGTAEHMRRLNFSSSFPSAGRCQNLHPSFLFRPQAPASPIPSPQSPITIPPTPTPRAAHLQARSPRGRCRSIPSYARPSLPARLQLRPFLPCASDGQRPPSTRNSPRSPHWGFEIRDYED